MIKDIFSTRVAALEAAKDIAELVPPLDMGRFDSRETWYCYRNGISFTLSALITTTGVFQDVNVRKAFFHSLDRVK